MSSIVSFAKKGKGRISEEDIWTLLIQSLSLLVEMQRFGVINGTLHPANLIITKRPDMRIMYYPKTFIFYSSNGIITEEVKFV